MTNGIPDQSFETFWEEAKKVFQSDGKIQLNKSTLVLFKVLSILESSLYHIHRNFTSESIQEVKRQVGNLLDTQKKENLSWAKEKTKEIFQEINRRKQDWIDRVCKNVENKETRTELREEIHYQVMLHLQLLCDE